MVVTALEAILSATMVSKSMSADLTSELVTTVSEPNFMIPWDKLENLVVVPLSVAFVSVAFVSVAFVSVPLSALAFVLTVFNNP